jgi:hypothetical protein
LVVSEDADRALELCAASPESFANNASKKEAKAAKDAAAANKPLISATFAADGTGRLAGDGRGVSIGGRTLLVTRAVDRSEAVQLTGSFDGGSGSGSGKAKAKVLGPDGKPVREDKRNLFLAREGLVLSASESAIGVSPADLKKRNAAYKEKKEKLKNPNYFISQTRLSIRNLPIDCQSHRLPSPPPLLSQRSLIPLRSVCIDMCGAGVCSDGRCSEADMRESAEGVEGRAGPSLHQTDQNRARDRPL